MIHCCQIVCVIEINIGDRNILEIEIYVYWHLLPIAKSFSNTAYCQS